MADVISSVPISDEDFVVLCAKQFLKSDIYRAKAWMMTGKTLFSENFGIQFEAYHIQKSILNAQEAAKCFSEVCEKFSSKPELWQEVEALTNSLRFNSFEPEAVFLREMFGYLSQEVQHKLLLMTADRSEDTMDHCRLLLLLLQRFPQSVSVHGPKLLETLMTAEKHSHYQNSVNCYRKLLVCDLLPLLVSSSVSLPPKQLFRLLNKAIEFSLNYLLSPTKLIQDLPELESKIEDPWVHLFLVVQGSGKKLGWDLSTMFAVPWNKEMYWQKILHTKKNLLLVSEEQRNYKELLYCGIVFFLRCFHEYTSSVEAGNGSEVPLVMVEAFTTKPPQTPTETKSKRRKVEVEDSAVPLLTVASLSSSAIVANFQMAVACWDLLHSVTNLEKEFTKLCQHMRLDLCLKYFLLDITLCKEVFDEALFILQSLKTSPTEELRKNLQLASIYYRKGEKASSIDHILQVVANLPTQTIPNPQSNVLVQATKKERHLHYLPLTRSHVLQYCVKFILTGLKKHIFSKQPCPDLDQAVGHAMTLIQYDWPAEESLAVKLLERIRRNRSFSYKLFRSYIVNVDLLEEFMYFSTDQGGCLALDIVSSSHHTSQRRISTRGADKGVKDDFKQAMKRQVARSNEPIENLIVKFLVTEKHSILQSLVQVTTTPVL
uniref:Integrator complex subunit 10 n=1 Tax=Timema tahoe TaxID=61484 RepID=A0A7R9FPA9_9NEOP|nr:unnamed protein product [Timema tahoe]